MTKQIHPSAVVSDKAIIGENVKVGPFCTIDEHVVLGYGCELLSHVSITGHTTIGINNRFFPFSSIGATAWVALGIAFIIGFVIGKLR